MWVAARRQALSSVSAAESLDTGAVSGINERTEVKPRGYWKSAENRRRFLDGIREAHGIERAEDWMAVRTEDVLEKKGSRFLSYYSNSLLAAVCDIYALEYTEAELAALQAHRHRNQKAKGHWDDVTSVAEWVARVEEELGIRRVEDWARVSLRQLQERGGRGLLKRFTLQEVLEQVYPGQGQQLDRNGVTAKKSSQRHLAITLAGLMAEG